MQKNKHQWAELLVKFWEGSLTAAERSALDRQRKLSPARESEFRQISNPAWNLARLREIHAATEDTEAGWQDVEQRAARLKRQALFLSLRRWTYRAAAAVLAGFVLYVAYDLMRQRFASSGKKPAPSSSLQTIAARILPPENDAKLILYDGSEYLLRKEKDGIIKQTNHLQIRKEGLAIYVKKTGAGGAPDSERNWLILPKGSTCILYLPDNSSVYMNASSTIEFPSAFAEEKRSVAIKGEAFIEIDPLQHTPFVVRLNNKYDVTATGTSFLVRSYPTEEQTIVKLASGKLHINSTAQQSVTKYVNPNEQFIANGRHESVVACNTPNADKTAWQQSSFNLEKDLRSVMEDIGNWYNMNVTIAAGIKNEQLSGTFSRTQALSLTLDHLRSVTGLRFRLSDQEIIVTK